MDALGDLQYHRTIKEEDVADCGFVEVETHDVLQLCVACLCSTRSTHMLDEDPLKQFYMNILTEMQAEGDLKVLLPPRLCWECVTHLKRLVRFREQVQESYRLLQPMLLTYDKEDVAEFLKTSVCRPGRLRTCFAHSINISPQDEDTRMMAAAADDGDDGMEQLPVLVKVERGLRETGEAASDSWEKNIEARPSTFRETVAPTDEDTFEAYSEKNNLGEDDEFPPPPMLSYQDSYYEMLEETAARSSKPVKQHLNTFNTAHDFICDYCFKRFNLKIELEWHIATHKNIDMKTIYDDVRNLHKCNVCDKLCYCKTSLVIHLRTHTGEKPFQCKVCHKSFSQLNNLIRHKTTHTGEKPFHCELCHRSFAQHGYLIKHRRTHSGEKPFQCKLCHKSFSLTHHLTNHIRSHTGEKPFQCVVCHLSFVNKSNLNRHRRVHTDTKPA